MAAQIIINQATRPPGVAGIARSDGVTAQLVTCTSATLATSYEWTVIDSPIRSTIVRGAVTAGPSFTFTPDVKGTYQIQLRLNGSSLGANVARSFIAVRSFGVNTMGWRYPGHTETLEDNQTFPGLGFPSNVNPRGWATNDDLILEDTEEAVARVVGAVVVSPGAGFDSLVKLDTATGQFDPSVIPGGGGGGLGFPRFRLPAGVTITVPEDFQYLVKGPLTVDPGATLTIDPGAQLAVI